MQDCSISLALLQHCVKTLMATYASTHIIDEIGLWQLETKSRVPEQEQGGGGEGGYGLAEGGGGHIPSLVIGRVHKSVEDLFFIL
jgi:hypothetical protein